MIFAWVNDETTLRPFGAKTDAYRVFKGMLEDPNTPDDWVALSKAVSDQIAVERMETASPPRL
jgi:toxin YhaV